MGRFLLVSLMVHLPPWSNTPTALLCDPALSPTAKLCAAAVGVHTNSRFEAVVSIGRLVTMLSLSRSTVQRGMLDLRESGWLEVRYAKGKDGVNEVNHYRWNFRQAGLTEDRMLKGRTRRDLPEGGSVTRDTMGSVKRGLGVVSPVTPILVEAFTRKNVPIAATGDLALGPSPAPSWLEGRRILQPNRYGGEE
jgi:hypothetical protein